MRAAFGYWLVSVAVLSFIAWPQAQATPAELAKAIARGKVVYGEQKCSACHMIAGVGNKRSVLDGVGGRLKAADVRLWVVAPRKMKPTVRKPDYTKVPPADVDALVAYLMTLTKP